MCIAIGSDERRAVCEAAIHHLRQRGHEVVPVGPLAGEAIAWADTAARVAEKVARGEADEGVVFCWTGTGSAMAANKVRGIRAALCNDAETALGARKWNDANVLAMSYRLVTEITVKEILDAWLSKPPVDKAEEASIRRLAELEAGLGGGAP